VTTTETTPGDAAIAEAEAKMAALVRKIDEEPDGEKKVSALKALADEWLSIGESLLAAGAAKSKAIDEIEAEWKATGSKTSNAARHATVLARLSYDERFQAVLAEYRRWSKHYLAILESQEERR
jgi:hypothetical protein